ncbi:MAG: adenylate/guanylate cyclase domain-containing protein [Sulfurimicrobium sp.]|jgi:class 3 adenylate cyclase|nr:adenylate/guanylate cyclase domain-containing protein [Sulfurimicrobium sp.]MDP2963411.1 adenylate/guanylate cyclase domain-containing protein [Sulfurimicrobium sp.]MDZ7655998.1 adenylate/guanylate cyclase domain-containing protein [Sulfurimicrobium sp.]
MNSSISHKIRGSRASYVARDFFTNSAHYAIANILLEMLSEGPRGYLLSPDPYAILLSALAQAYFLGTMQFREQRYYLLGNLIGPALYTLFEFFIDGMVFVATPNHIGYWLFALAIGALQQARASLPERLSGLWIVLENLARTYILVAGYWMFEARTEVADHSLAGFFSNASHVYVFLAVNLIALLIGLANVQAHRYLLILRDMAAELQRYSEWLLGARLLEQAVSDPAAMSLKRQYRAVVFADIRGFTGWSESMPPEQVVAMLNCYFELAEEAWRDTSIIKAKFTGDEVMIVFDSAVDAVRVARRLNLNTLAQLAAHGLSVGIGIHSGPLVEGLMGSHEMKGYDVVGDTVNTAKRICDSAVGGEILISRDACQDLPLGEAEEQAQQIPLKGKQVPLDVFRLVLAPSASGL